MKNAYSLLMALIICTAALAQPTPHEKEVLKNDLVRERDKRNDVARDIFRGDPEKARADHRVAVAYHKKIHRDIHQIHHNDVVRHARYHPHHHYYKRHYHRHYYHPRPHAKVVVTVRH